MVFCDVMPDNHNTLKKEATGSSEALVSTKLHGVITQNSMIIIPTAVTTAYFIKIKAILHVVKTWKSDKIDPLSIR